MLTVAQLTTIQYQIAAFDPFATTLNSDAFQAWNFISDIDVCEGRNDVVREEVLLAKASNYYSTFEWPTQTY